MRDFKNEGCNILLSSAADGLHMLFTGKIDERESRNDLMKYFDELLTEIDTALTIDFASLEYMNSASMISIIQFIKKLEDKNIKTLVLYDKNSFWQNASYKAIIALTKKFKNITVEGR